MYIDSAGTCVTAWEKGYRGSCPGITSPDCYDNYDRSLIKKAPLSSVGAAQPYIDMPGNRIAASFLDFITAVYISSIVVYIFTLGKMDVNVFSITVYLVCLLIYMLFKDMVFKNASIWKRLFHIKIEKIDGSKLKLIDHIKRNLPLILVPLEIFLVLFNGQRLGDIFAGTHVVEAN